MKKWMIASIVFVLLASVVSVASADPGNGPNAYTMTVDCGQGDVIIQVLNGHSVASFRVGSVHGDVGILKAIYIQSDGTWIPILYVPGKGVYEQTETCTWEEGGFTFKAEVLIPHE